MKDYYKILEIEENASEDDIKKSYRALSKKYHPDVNPNGDETFKEVLEAYDVLSDKQKRGEYDFRRKNPHQDMNMQDIFSNFFGKRQQRKKSPDKIVRINITPVESYNNSTKTINYIKDYKCNTCNGEGGEKQICGGCGGQGYQSKIFSNGFMIQQINTECSSCAGRGYTLIHKCNGCDGRGYKSFNNTLNIKLPHGIDSGQFIRIPNEGDFRNGDYGDLIIQIELMNSDGFEKIGNDLVYNLFLNYKELLNDKYNIPHPNGTITIESPKKFDTSKPLRVKGKGYNGGELYIKLNVKFDRP